MLGIEHIHICSAAYFLPLCAGTLCVWLCEYVSFVLIISIVFAWQTKIWNNTIYYSYKRYVLVLGAIFISYSCVLFLLPSVYQILFIVQLFAARFAVVSFISKRGHWYAHVRYIYVWRGQNIAHNCQSMIAQIYVQYPNIGSRRKFPFIENVQMAIFSLNHQRKINWPLGITVFVPILLSTYWCYIYPWRAFI